MVCMMVLSFETHFQRRNHLHQSAMRQGLPRAGSSYHQIITVEPPRRPPWMDGWMDGWMADLLLDVRGSSPSTSLRCHLRNCDSPLASPMISACNDTNKLPANGTKFVTVLAKMYFPCAYKNGGRLVKIKAITDKRGNGQLPPD